MDDRPTATIGKTGDPLPWWCPPERTFVVHATGAAMTYSPDGKWTRIEAQALRDMEGLFDAGLVTVPEAREMLGLGEQFVGAIPLSPLPPSARVDAARAHGCNERERAEAEAAAQVACARARVSIGERRGHQTRSDLAGASATKRNAATPCRHAVTDNVTTSLGRVLLCCDCGMHIDGNPGDARAK